MGEPASKAKIIERLHAERRRLEQNVARLSREDLHQSNAVGEWSFKDVLAHVAHWESFLADWIPASRRGEMIDASIMSDLDSLNRTIFETHRNDPLDEVLENFRGTHTKFMELAERLNDQEIFAPGHFAFTGDGALYGWLLAYADHDLWAKAKIGKSLRESR